MKVLFLQDVPKVGQKYQIKEVSSGYARNFLIPRNLVKIATDKVVQQTEKLKLQGDAERKIRADLLIKNIKDLEKVTIQISGKANDKGHLFAGIHKEELIVAIKEQTHLDVDTDHLDLEHPLKETGEHKISVAVGEIKSSFTVNISATKE